MFPPRDAHSTRTSRRAAAALLLLAGLGTTAVVHAGSPTRGPLISGTASWIDGTHAWTDYAYDDRGTTPAASYPGRIYPSDATANAADLIQLQLGLARDRLVIRAVLETLTDPASPLLGIGLDLDANPATGAPALPGAGWTVSGTPLGLERLVVVGANGTRVMAWKRGAWRTTDGPAPTIDPADNTMRVAIPLDRLGPRGTTWRAVGVLGLASAGHSWLDDGGPILDLAYVRDPSSASWQSGLQADVLAGQADAAQAVAILAIDDFLQRRTTRAQPVPGAKNTLLYRSALELGEGIQGTDRKYAGPYQPYVAWFPPDLPVHAPLIVFMHGALQNHLTGPYGETSDGDADLGLLAGRLTPKAVIVTPLGRGEAFGWYTGASEQDVLDVVADAQRRFRTDPERVVLSGYSLGGVGTFNLAQLYPDRWTAAIDIVGAPDLGLVELLRIAPPLPSALENLRNLPFRLAHSRLDELEIIVGVIQPDLAALRLHALGYDYRYWQFYRRDHLNFPVPVLQCEYEVLAARPRVVDPPRVVFSLQPALQRIEPESGLDLRHDRAYWMSELTARGTSFRPRDKATVDITTLALPDREPRLRPIAQVTENLTGGRDVCGPNPDIRTFDVWTVVGQAWEGYEDAPLRNAIAATLTGVASVRLDVARMGLDVTRAIAIDVRSDGDSRLRLAGPWRGRGVVVEHDGQAATTACPAQGVIDVAIPEGIAAIRLRPGPRCE